MTTALNILERNAAEAGVTLRWDTAPATPASRTVLTCVGISREMPFLPLRIEGRYHAPGQGGVARELIAADLNARMSRSAAAA